MPDPIEFAAGDALLIVDAQVDFCPGGALALAEGDAVMPVLSRLAAAAAAGGRPVCASRDWHPRETRHFRKWPAHCVAGTRGAEFHPALRLPPATVVISKGTGGEDDGYSAFEGRAATGSTLEQELRRRGVGRLFVGGLATDYCVRATVLDALARDFAVTVIRDAVRAVDLEPGDGARALEEMARAGARLVEAGPARPQAPPEGGAA